MAALRELPSNFDTFHSCYDWKEIPNCPGRYTLHPQKTVSFDVQQFLCNTDKNLESIVNEWPTNTWLKKWEKGQVVRDILWAVRLEDNCGVISYEHKTGGFLHTLNTASGFERKLKALHIYDHVYEKDNKT